MIFEEIHETLIEKGCDICVLSSAYSEIEKALEVLKSPIENMIEIGTHNGLSSSIFTYYAKRVFTFDVALRNAEYIWNLLGVRNKISSFVSARDNIEWELNYIKTNNYWQQKNCNFNFAFIDGSHEYEIVARDFELVKFTKRVLFHDTKTSPGAHDFCRDLGLTPLADVNFSYWEAT